jgi:spectinomycin phosphotransferase
LLSGWAVQVAQLEYVPVGGGSHHWLVHDDAGQRHWVTVDDLDDKSFLGDTSAEAFVALHSALDTALTLRETGLDFVLAPLRSKRGQTVEPLGARYAVAMYPYLVGTSDQFGAARSVDERVEVVDMLVRLHRATPSVAALARHWRLSVATRPMLDDALNDLDQPWPGGPYAEPARDVVASHAPALRHLLATFDQLAVEVAAVGAEPVITHGEPHAANFIRADGRLFMIDWDTVALGPPERDLWMVSRDGGDELARYTELSGRSVNPTALRLYRLRWLVDDISIVVGRFRSAHADTADMAHAWRALIHSLASPDILR